MRLVLLCLAAVSVSCSDSPTSPTPINLTGTWVGGWQLTRCDTNFDARNCGRPTSGSITLVINHSQFPNAMSVSGTVVWLTNVGISVDGSFSNDVLRLRTSTVRPAAAGFTVRDWETRVVSDREMRGRGAVESRGMFGDREIFLLKEFDIPRLRQVSRETDR